MGKRNLPSRFYTSWNWTLSSVEKQTSLIHIHHRNAEFGRDKVRRASISSPKQTCPRSLGANQEVEWWESPTRAGIGDEALMETRALQRPLGLRLLGLVRKRIPALWSLVL
ncbi:hypothetical protein SAY86_010290 [Trapa natans]|uniref:Uncharacterized protein n=1 Tax=Trapa natans TaxID=22666 RepID=A0AAN7QTP9_TRANT|nr:hypothetical protein SAY86_010290 [Trapa natans]